MKRSYILLALLVIIFIALRIIFFVGAMGYDDLAYNYSAHKIVTGKFTLDNIDLKEFRFAITIPLALFQLIFGAGEFSCALVSIISTLGLCFIVMWFCKKLISPTAGLIAFFLMCIFPLGILFSTVTLPDIPQVFLSALAVLLLLKGHEKSSYKLLLASGLVMGISYLAKETAIHWFIFCVVWMLVSKYKLTEAVAFIFSTISIFIAESAVYFLIKGNALLRFSAINATYVKELQETFYPSTSAIIERLTIGLPDMLLNPLTPGNIAYGFYFLIAVIIAIYYLSTKKELSKFALVLFVSLFLTYNFIPARAYPYLPNTIHHRYLFPFAIPAIIIISTFIEKLRARKLVILGIVAFAGVQLFCTYINFYHARYDAFCVKSAYKYIANLDSGIIYADDRSTRMFELLNGYKNDRKFAPLNTNYAKIKKGDVVVLNYQWIYYDNIRYGLPMDTPYYRPQKSWQLIKVISAGNRKRLGIFPRIYDSKEKAYIYRVVS